jgi:hypothetical protein
MSDKIRVNDNVYSWGSITLKCRGVTYYGFDSVSFGDKRERSFQYGMGKSHAPRGRARGKYSTEPGKLGGSLGTIQQLLQDLAALSDSGKSFGDVEFDVVVDYFEKDELPLTVVLRRCVITATTNSHEEGPDGLKGELELSYFSVERNGVTLYSR